MITLGVIKVKILYKKNNVNNYCLHHTIVITSNDLCLHHAVIFAIKRAYFEPLRWCATINEASSTVIKCSTSSIHSVATKYIVQARYENM